MSFAYKRARECILSNGDRMSRKEFHLAYSKAPEDYRAELIGGMVFEPSPLSYQHSTNHARLISLLVTYSIATPGTGVADNVTVMLSDEDEVQPDAVIRIEQHGRTRLTPRGKYVQGPPELVAEVAASSRAIDLHLKKERYALAGVIEYIVVCLRPQKFYWFNLAEDRQLSANTDGIFKSSVFPGLWIHGDGLLQLDHNLTGPTLDRGLKSKEHKDFVAVLKKRMQS